MSTILQRCQHCRKQIENSKLMLHEMYCERNCIRCERCGLMYDQNDQESHDEEFHKSIECPNCHEGVPGLYYYLLQLDLNIHQCPKKPTPCLYCKLDIPLNKFREHEIQCGSRTDKCDSCGQYVKIKDFENHHRTCIMRKMNDQSRGLKEEFPLMEEVQVNQSQKYQQKKEEQQKFPREERLQQKQQINNKNQQIQPIPSEDQWKPKEIPRDQPQGRQPSYKKQIFDNPPNQPQPVNPVINKTLARPEQQYQPINQGSYLEKKYSDNSKFNNDKIYETQAVRSHQFRMPGQTEESLLNTQPLYGNQFKQTQIPSTESQNFKQNRNSNFVQRPQENKQVPQNTFIPPPVQQAPDPKFKNYRNEDAHQPPKFQASNKPPSQPFQAPPPANEVPEEMVNDSMIARKIQVQMYAEDLGLTPEECEKQYDTQLTVFPNGNASSIYKHLMYKPEDLKPKHSQPQMPVQNAESELQGFEFLSEEERLEQLRLYESFQNNIRRKK